MATNRIVTKALASVEDLLHGVGTVNQIRSGNLVTVNRINADNLSYDDTLSIKDKFADNTGKLAKKPEVLNTVAEMQVLDT